MFSLLNLCISFTLVYYFSEVYLRWRSFSENERKKRHESFRSLWLTNCDMEKSHSFVETKFRPLLLLWLHARLISLLFVCFADPCVMVLSLSLPSSSSYWLCGLKFDQDQRHAWYCNKPLSPFANLVRYTALYVMRQISQRFNQHESSN